MQLVTFQCTLPRNSPDLDGDGRLGREEPTVSAVRHGTQAGEVQYLVLPDPSNPWLLARVRWPDVFQAISAAEPDWRSDPGLFDLPYDPSSHVVADDEAAAIAEAWGARLPAADEAVASGPLLLRRMPANWSDLSRAEKRAWSIDHLRKDPAARSGRLSFRRRRAVEARPADEQPDVATIDVTVHHVDPDDVIDLTDARDGALSTVDDA